MPADTPGAPGFVAAASLDDAEAKRRITARGFEPVEDWRRMAAGLAPSGPYLGSGGTQGSPDETGDQAQQSMFRDIDAILARVETGIAAERSALDTLLDRLTSKAA